VLNRRKSLAWVLVAVACVLQAGCGYFPGYVLDPADLEEIVGQVDAATGEEAVDQVQQALEAQGYPVVSEPTWVFNSGSGLSGQTAALYVSANEYLLLGAVNGNTEWSLGPYPGLDVYDYVLFGDLSVYQAQDLNPPVLGASESFLLTGGAARQYRTTDGVFVLEYGRGLLPGDLYADAFVSRFPLAQGFIVYTSGSFVTSFIRNWVYEQIGLPGGLFALAGM
jgi:hypothetical protein